MSDINQVTLEGRLVRDPDLRSTPSGVSVCDIFLANNKTVKRPMGIDQETTEFQQLTTFIKVTLWNDRAERWSDILKKGDKILVIGKLVDDNYVPKNQEIETRGRLKVDNIERLVVLAKGV